MAEDPYLERPVKIKMLVKGVFGMKHGSDRVEERRMAS
jgi:hypothetical protein